MIIFYKDINADGGVPSEIRTFIKLNKSDKNQLVILNSYLELFIYSLKKKFKVEVVFVGFFFVHYLFFWFLFALFKTDITIWSLGQISKYAISKDIFTTVPIISKMDPNSKIHKTEISYIKPLFLKFSRLIFKIRKPKFWIFSLYEKKELERYFGSITYDLVYWNCGDNLNYYTKSNQLSSMKNEFSDKKILLCWSRIDVQNKGIDRFFKLTRSLNKISSDYLSVTCGPHYSGDIQEIQDTDGWILLNTLEKKNRNINFLDANFIVLLSRWDGFPRVLREAISHNIPIIVSKETHFAEIVKQFRIGLVYNKDFDAHSILNFNFDLCDFTGALKKINS